MDEFEKDILDFLNEIEPQMKELVEKAGHVPSLIPTWEPSYGADAALTMHTSNMCIPRSGLHLPDLLLHGLGEETTNLAKQRAERLEKIFSTPLHKSVP